MNAERRPGAGAASLTSGENVRTTVPPFQVMPAMSNEEFQALKTDIAERGQLVPIMVTSDGDIIDGHHRDRACRELGITPRIEVSNLDTDTARDLAFTLNLSRRHLTREQKRDLIRVEIERGDTDRAIARRLSCSPSTVGSVRRSVQLGHETAALKADLGTIWRACHSLRYSGMTWDQIADWCEAMTTETANTLGATNDPDFTGPVMRHIVAPRIAFVRSLGRWAA